MPLRSLVIIALRVYAIYWLAVSISQLLVYLPTILALPDVTAGPTPYFVLIVPVGMFLIAAMMWVFAGRLSDKIVKGEETQLVFTTLTRHDFYLFAFIFLGLYFVLSSIEAVLQASYSFYEFELLAPDSQRHGQYLIPMLGRVFTIVAGFFCIFRGRKWTKMMIALDNKYADSLEKPSASEKAPEPAP